MFDMVRLGKSSKQLQLIGSTGYLVVVARSENGNTGTCETFFFKFYTSMHIFVGKKA
jgi:hypothetical protein